MRAEGTETVRRILCVFPRYTSSFGTFEHAYPLTDGVRAFMPPQGLLVIAAYLPADWPVRFVDENIRPAARDEGRPEDRRSRRNERLSDSGLWARRGQTVSARQHPVFERVPLPVRILRHSGPLWPQPAAEDAAADRHRTRQASRMRHDRYR